MWFSVVVVCATGSSGRIDPTETPPFLSTGRQGKGGISVSGGFMLLSTKILTIYRQYCYWAQIFLINYVLYVYETIYISDRKIICFVYICTPRGRDFRVWRIYAANIVTDHDNSWQIMFLSLPNKMNILFGKLWTLWYSVWFVNKPTCIALFIVCFLILISLMFPYNSLFLYPLFFFRGHVALKAKTLHQVQVHGTSFKGLLFSFGRFILLDNISILVSPKNPQFPTKNDDNIRLVRL